VPAELFAALAPTPLAERLRPKTLGDILGQEHLLGPEGPLGRMLAARKLGSAILWGPPGCGKTTIARLLAEQTDLHFEPLSAVFSGVADLRRMVIDKMVSSGGWVVNDFVREVNGHRIFVVTGRTPKDALTPEKMWMFYFTEAGGRIYGLTTDSPVELADRMTTEAERFIESLRAKN